MRALLLALALALVMPAAASAVEPDEMLDDPALEARARTLSKQIRCLVCQNQSIDDSNATLAKDLRVIVRERLVSGDDDTAVLDYLVSRYGDFVLLNPRMQPTTYALWFGPAAILLLAATAVAALTMRRRRRFATLDAPPLSDEERRRLEALVDEAAGDSGSDRQ